MNQEFGNFLLTEKLDEGGMGKVYRAIVKGAAGFEKTVIIKQILPQYCRDANYIRQFRREALIAANLNHPNIVQIYHFDQVDGQYYIEMEFIDGMDLHKMLRKCRECGLEIPLGVCLDIARQIARGLEYAYQTPGKDGRPLTLVHRDLDLRNVLLSWDGFAKIIDFDLSKAKEEISEFSQAGEFKGKLIYAAPEQFGGMALDNRTDFYALGVMLYTMVLGQYPFDSGDVRRLVAAKAEGGYRHPKLVSPDLPMAVSLLITTCLEPDPNRRYATVGALLEAIEKAETAVPAACSPREFMHRLRKRLGAESSTPEPGAPPAASFAEAKTVLFDESCELKMEIDHEASFSEFAVKAQQLHPQLGDRRDILAEIVQHSRRKVVMAIETAQREAARIVRDVCSDRGVPLQTEQPLAEVDRLTQEGVMPVDVALALHAIRIMADRALRLNKTGVVSAKDAIGLLVHLFEALRWYYCDFADGPRLPELYVEKSDEKLTMVVSNLVADAEKTHGTQFVPHAQPIIPLLVRIPAGPFLFGVHNSEEDAAPDERSGVELDLPEYRIGKFPVTNQEYFLFCKETDHPLPAAAAIPHLAEPNRPVTGVDFHDAAAYVEWLAELTGKPFRLPREEEWEKAARGGLMVDGEANPLPGRRFPWGDRFRPGIANVGGRFGGPTAIHDFPFNKSPYNCYDMAGNVWEWCLDWYDPDAQLKRRSNAGGQLASGEEKVLRGGSWYGGESDSRCTRRVHRPLDCRSFDIGFRICCER